MGTPAVFGPKFCFNHQVQVEMKEEWFVQFGGYPIKDIYGQELYKVENGRLDTNLIEISTGQQIGQVTRKACAFRPTYHIYTNHDNRRVTFNHRYFPVLNRTAYGYILKEPYPTRDSPTEVGDLTPDLIIRSTKAYLFSRVTEVEILDGKTNIELARISRKEAKQVLSDTTWQTHLLTIQPGVDTALMILTALFFNISVKDRLNINLR